MDFFLSPLQALKYVVPLCTALGAIVPWSDESIKANTRGIVVLIAGLLTFLLWPVDFSYCRYTAAYAWTAGALALCFFLAHFGDLAITDRYSLSVVIDGELKRVIGGPRLTAAALALKPDHSDPEIFRLMKYDPSLMFERGPRTWIVIVHHALVISRRLALLLAIAAACAAAALRYEAVRLHKEPLTLETPDERVIVADGSPQSRRIVPKHEVCNRAIKWKIDAPEALKATGALGEVQEDTGTYFAPSHVRTAMDVHVIATPAEHDWERTTITLHLKPYPDYSDAHHAVGQDSKGKQAHFRIDVIDARHSWKIGKYELEGGDGETFIREMAADGMFSGFEDIICIGAASREILQKLTRENARELEEQRARDRAVILGNWVRNAIAPQRMRIHTLKVGRYNEETRLPPEMTARERQVVIVGVKDADRGIILKDAVRDAFAKKRAEEPLLGMYLDKYPEHHWVIERLGARKAE